MTVEPQYGIRALWRWVIGIVGALWLAALGVGFIVNRAIDSYYFHDYGWPGVGAMDVLFIAVGVYLVLVASIGRWKIWR